MSRSCIINNIKDDTLMIKILPLTTSSQYEKKNNHISGAFGVTLQWTITLLSGEKKIQLENQRFQLNYGSFQLPYVSMGLGRTNNYVEDLTVGYDGSGDKNTWSPIIPNSQLLVYRKDDVWKLETLLSNTERVYYVIYVSIGFLILLGLVILCLNHR